MHTLNPVSILISHRELPFLTRTQFLVGNLVTLVAIALFTALGWDFMDFPMFILWLWYGAGRRCRDLGWSPWVGVALCIIPTVLLKLTALGILVVLRTSMPVLEAMTFVAMIANYGPILLFTLALLVLQCKRGVVGRLPSQV